MVRLAVLALLAVLTAQLLLLSGVDATVREYTFRVTAGVVDPLSPAYVVDNPDVQNTALALKGAILVNGVFPGPLIDVFEGDIVRVNVFNRMTESTSIHWHGLDQPGTPYMDGVPHVTQCPIRPGTNFTYEFVATPAGTRMWHSHSPGQAEVGMLGGFVVRRHVEPHGSLYTDERLFLLTDWHRDHRATMIRSSSMTSLVNGLWGDGSSGYPFPVINVTAGVCYRFRAVHAGGEIDGFNVRFAGHTIKIISKDGNDIVPIPGQTGFAISPGERIDFVLCADQTPGNYLVAVDPATYFYTRDAVVFLHYTSVAMPGTTAVGTHGGDGVSPGPLSAN
jgi:FtsP/CotA-like multicopper oxidase with cupredoxin domain